MYFLAFMVLRGWAVSNLEIRAKEEWKCFDQLIARTGKCSLIIQYIEHRHKYFHC